MKQCILLAISFVLLLGLMVCSLVPEESIQEESSSVVAVLGN